MDPFNRIDQAIEDLEEAQATLEELNECGDLEERMDAAFEVDACERRLAKLRIDGV